MSGDIDGSVGGGGCSVDDTGGIDDDIDVGCGDVDGCISGGGWRK